MMFINDEDENYCDYTAPSMTQRKILTITHVDDSNCYCKVFL